MDSKLVWGNKQGKEFDLKLFGCKNGARQHIELVRDKKEPEIISRDFKIFNSKQYLFDYYWNKTLHTQIMNHVIL